MPKLSDLQLVLLSTGSQRDDGALLPLPPAITATPMAIGKAVAVLVRRGFSTKNGEVASITDAGRIAIGVEPAVAPEPAAPSASGPAPGTRQAQVIALLRRPGGASLTELTSATGWLPHTTRAALTGLRKRGHDIIKDKVDGVTRYRITG